MARTPRPSGVTLVEVMVAMAVLMVGAVGLAALHRIGVRTNADARVMTRAAAIGQDLITQLQSWDFTNDPRLRNTNTGNDADFADSSGSFEQPVGSFVFDHQESELESQSSPYTWLGVPSATVQGLGFARYWNVAEVDHDPSGTLDARRVAVIVRWERNGVGRRIVLVTVLRNPAGAN